ncbi:unnamed protein product, partial [Medioppia subpectinata]
MFGQQRERMKLFSQLSLLATTVDSKVHTILKIDDCPQVDDSSLILLSLPNGPSVQTSAPIGHSFHSFCITSQTGQRIYGGSYVFSHSNVIPGNTASNGSSDTDAVNTGVVYTTRALVALTVRPLVDQLYRCLEWCVVRGDCNSRWIRCVSQMRLPPKGKCIQIVFPIITSNVNHRQQLCACDASQGTCDHLTHYKSDDHFVITILRPLSTLPLFDYSLRRLFSQVLSVDQFLLCYCCALIETQILIISSDYYVLMLVAESLSALLNPFKWQHVYVPILPNKLGLHYLDAPTPYIMGIRKSPDIPPANQLMVGCLIDCDEHSVELNVEPSLLVMPPFMDTLKQELETLLNADLRLSCLGTGVSGHTKSATLQRLTELAKKHNVINDEFTYLDDLKLNQQIRVVFLKTMRKHILHKYQQFIIYNRKDSILFDTVSYLSDRPQSMQPFLQQFVSTQMFVTFIDEMGKQLIRKHKTIANNTCSQQSLYESIYDDDFEELDLSLFTDQILESRFQTAKQISLQDLEQIPTVDSTAYVCYDASQLSTTAIASPRTRRRFHTLSQKSTNLTNTSLAVGSPLGSPLKAMPAALTAQTNWRVVETLMKEVKIKTKRILLEKMGVEEVGPLGCGTVGGVEENTLIAALCDLIERIWSHARTDDNKDVSNKWQSGRCSFWSHLMAYYQLETNDAIDGAKHKAIDSSQLTPALSQMSMDSSPQSTPSSPSKSSQVNYSINSKSPFKSLPTTILYDISQLWNPLYFKIDANCSNNEFISHTIATNSTTTDSTDTADTTHAMHSTHLTGVHLLSRDILLSLPNGPSVQTSAPIGHSFHSFCITSQTGQRIYGGSYVFSHSNVIPGNTAINGSNGSSDVNTDVNHRQQLCACDPSEVTCDHLTHYKSDEHFVITILRPLSTLPLFDYSLRRLFSQVLSVD